MMVVDVSIDLPLSMCVEYPVSLSSLVATPSSWAWEALEDNR